MVIVMLASIGLTACRTVTLSDQTFRSILIAQSPILPMLPEWPDVVWAYEDGRYSLNEADVDKVLNYLENDLTLYKFEIEAYKEKLQIVLDGIMAV